MNQNRPLNLERYRRMQQKGLVSPRARNSFVPTSRNAHASPRSPDPQGRSLMPVANAYRDAAPSPTLMGPFSCGPILGHTPTSTKSRDHMSARENGKQLHTPQERLKSSLFDEAKRERYEKFKNRVRMSLSPDPPTKAQDNADGTRGNPISVQGEHNMRRLSPNIQSSERLSKAIGASPRSAFSLPTTSGPSSQRRSIPDLPAAPSCVSDSSSHPLNAYGVPAASTSHDQASTRSAGTPTSTTSSSQRRKHRQSPVTSDMLEDRRRPARSRPNKQKGMSPQAPHAVNRRNKPSLVINPLSTPTAKPPPISYSSSSERGVTPPPRPPTSKTPRSVSSASISSSVARRDRILEARELEHSNNRTPRSTRTLEDVQNERYDSNSQFSPSLASTDSSRMETSTLTSNSSTPMSFYRKIVAEKRERAAMVRQNTTPSPSSRQKVPAETIRNASRMYSAISPRGTPSQRAFHTNDTRRQGHMYRSESPRGTPAPSIDQGTIRLLYSTDFQQMIHDEGIPRSVRRTIQRNDSVSFTVRKRPLLEEELDRGDFDIIHVDSEPDARDIVLYETMLLSDLKNKSVEAKSFQVDKALPDTASTEEFYLRVGQSDMVNVRDGGCSVFLFIGATGSGKTHSMEDIEERAAHDLFSLDAGSSNLTQAVSVQYLQISDNHIVDVLGPIGNSVRIVEENGQCHFSGAQSKSATGPNELLGILSDAKRRLSKTAGSGYGVLCLMTVHTEHHDGFLFLMECPATLDETREANAGTFDILRRSLRARGSGRTPNLLTRHSGNIMKAVQPILLDVRSKVSVVASVSPAATATESTLATLSSLNSVLGIESNEREDTSEREVNNESIDVTAQENISPKSIDSSGGLVLPRQWSNSDLVDWMKRKNLMGNQVPPDINGRFAMRMSKRQLKNTFYDVDDDVKAEKLFVAMRAENDRIARMRVKLRMAREKERYSALS